MGGKGGQQPPADDSEKKSSDGKYMWQQKNDEIQVRFLEHEGLTKKDINVKFSTKNLKVELKGETIVDGPLFNSVEADECCWSIDPDTRFLQIMLTKKEGDSSNWSSLMAA